MLDLRKLKCFVVVAEELNFRRAAERLHMAQPPLTRKIAALEDELGIQLLDRSRRVVTLSKEGQQFLPQAKALLLQASQTENAAMKLAQGVSGHLEIGYVSSVPLSDIFSDTIKVFSQKYPDVTIAFEEVSSRSQIEKIADGRMDIGFIRPIRSRFPSTIRSLKLRNEPLLVALHDTHPLASRKAISLKILEGETFILFPASYGSGLNDKIHTLCAESGFVPNVGLVAEQITTIIALVAARQGISIVPASLAALQKHGIRYIPLSGPHCSMDIMLVFRHNKPSPCVRSFIEIAGSMKE